MEAEELHRHRHHPRHQRLHQEEEPHLADQRRKPIRPRHQPRRPRLAELQPEVHQLVEPHLDFRLAVRPRQVLEHQRPRLAGQLQADRRLVVPQPEARHPEEPQDKPQAKQVQQAAQALDRLDQIRGQASAHHHRSEVVRVDQPDRLPAAQVSSHQVRVMDQIPANQALAVPLDRVLDLPKVGRHWEHLQAERPDSNLDKLEELPEQRLGLRHLDRQELTPVGRSDSNPEQQAQPEDHSSVRPRLDKPQVTPELPP